MFFFPSARSLSLSLSPSLDCIIRFGYQPLFLLVYLFLYPLLTRKQDVVRKPKLIQMFSTEGITDVPVFNCEGQILRSLDIKELVKLWHVWLPCFWWVARLRLAGLVHGSFSVLLCLGSNLLPTPDTVVKFTDSHVSCRHPWCWHLVTQLNSTQLGFNKNDSRWLKIYKHRSSNYTYLIEHTKYEIVIVVDFGFSQFQQYQFRICEIDLNQYLFLMLNISAP